MVRINLVNPKKLADQHLIAEYVEIMMLVGHAKKKTDVSKIPEKYRLGKGHINFFKNKLVYLKNRHERIKKEMKNRGFKAKKSISLKGFAKHLHNDWKHTKDDEYLIKQRLRERIMSKPNYYRYKRKKRDFNFFDKLLN